MKSLSAAQLLNQVTVVTEDRILGPELEPILRFESLRLGSKEFVDRNDGRTREICDRHGDGRAQEAPNHANLLPSNTTENESATPAEFNTAMSVRLSEGR